MRARVLVVASLLVSCRPGAAPAALPTMPGTVSQAPDPSGPREPSSACAFASRDALCASLRATYRAYSPWVAASCGYGAREVRDGPIAEAMYVGIRQSDEAPDASTVFVERPFLDGTIREPENAGSLSTQLVLAVRIGSTWYPASVFVGPRGAENTEQYRVTWSLDDDGRFLEWTEEEGASLRDQGSGYGATERTLLSTDGRAPLIVARETLERWNAVVDSPCAEACNSVPAPPPYPECDLRCATVVTTTQTWTRTPDALRIGASTTRVEGRPSTDAGENAAESSPARTYDLRSHDGWMSTCGFTPVPLAVPPAALSSEPEDVAARAHAVEVMRHGRWRELPQARAAVAEAAAEAIVELRNAGGAACGGGGCTLEITYRTIEGSFPDEGLSFFRNERGPTTGCEPSFATSAEPGASSSTLVRVALAAEGAALGCGFDGFDGETRRRWVVLSVFEPATFAPP